MATARWRKKPQPTTASSTSPSGASSTSPSLRASSASPSLRASSASPSLRASSASPSPVGASSASPAPVGASSASPAPAGASPASPSPAGASSASPSSAGASSAASTSSSSQAASSSSQLRQPAKLRAKHMTKYVPHPSLFLRTRKYSKLRLPPVFEIYWTLPWAHYLIQKIKQKNHAYTAEKGEQLKLHFMIVKRKTRSGLSSYDKSKVHYLIQYFCTEYPCLDYQNNTENYIERSFNKHMSTQGEMDEQHALEFMASCHDRFQMSTLVTNMKLHAQAYAAEKSLFFRAHPSIPEKVQMHLGDVSELAREMLGFSFFPKIRAKQVGNDLYLHEISLLVSEFVEPVYRDDRFSGANRMDIVTF